MSRGILVLIFLLPCATATPPMHGADWGYEAYTDWLGWARRSSGCGAGLASSYDRSGGNNDFSHYEYPTGLRTDEVLATIKTIQGPGVIHRFWMPHLTAKQGFVVRMFFDGEPTPRIDTTSDVLFAQGFGYFSAPFVNTCAGGQVSYEPVAFADSLRIETINHVIESSVSQRHYYQYTYTTLPPGTPLTSYTGTLTPEQQAARTAAADLFINAGQHPAGDDPSAVTASTPSTSIPPGGSCTLLCVEGPGIIRRLNFDMGSAGDTELDGLSLVVCYDTEPSPAIDVPVAFFFGAGHQRALYCSLPLGTNSPEGFYSYWPMPFRQSISVALHNTTPAPIAINSAEVQYTATLVGNDLCYLRVHACTNIKKSGQIYHPILSATGRGQYVGNFLFLHQPSYSFNVLEGDESITVDGVSDYYGTGLEDAYNGGYYYNWVVPQADEPEGVMPTSAVRPLSGALYVHREVGVEDARADQYRWYIADRVSFEDSIEVKIENRYSVNGAEWTSVAFWYQQPRLPGDIDDDGDVDDVDLSLFVQTLLDPEFYPDYLAAADISGDGEVNGADVQGFVGAFLNQ